MLTILRKFYYGNYIMYIILRQQYYVIYFTVTDLCYQSSAFERIFYFIKAKQQNV